MKKKKKKRIIKSRRIILVILLLLSNSFAWFIYATEVDNDMSAHVRAWKVVFEAGDSPIVDYVNIDIDSMYPGMQDFSYEINAYNRSEVSASLSYTLLEAQIMDEKYITVEGREELGEEAVDTDLTSEELLQKLENDYPFHILFQLTSTAIDPSIGKAKYMVKANWPYENGNDELDTLWGTKASQFKEEHPDTPTILLKLKISVFQEQKTQ